MTEKKWNSSLMMRALRGEPTERAPIWLMRQAGRYMQEYRDVRAEMSFLELCKNPAMCADVMLTAVNKLGVDAAILFSDLLVLLEPMGLPLAFSSQDGPIISRPIRSPDDVQRLKELTDLSSLEFVFEAVNRTRNALDESLPLIGFAGAPFTLLSYAMEGGSSRNFRITKNFMYSHPSAWHEFMQRFARSISRFLIAQIDAGCQIVQLFDSWVGCLGTDDYRQFVLPHTKYVIQTLKAQRPDCPLIHFGAGNPILLPLFAESGGLAYGVDWRVPLLDAWKTIGFDKSIQGNLDPVVLLSNPEFIVQRAKELLDFVGKRPGFIFNLGHGVLPQTPVENVLALIRYVQGR